MNVLNNIKIATPCTANWEEMQGNDRVRFCAQCERNVYNLSALSQTEALGLINQTEGRLCVRFYQRQDGTILTTDCPVGVKALKRKVARAANWTMFALLGIASWLTNDKNVSLPEIATILVNKVTDVATPRVTMGGLVAPASFDQQPNFQANQAGKVKTPTKRKHKRGL